MTTLILVRHGQSMGNLERRFLGHTDLPLSDMGHAQAARVAEHLADTKIDAVYSSDLSRAYRTAAPVAEARGLTITTDTDLREIYAGAWENQTFAYIHEMWGDAFSTFRSDIGVSCPTGGEPAMHVGERVFACLSRIAEKEDGKCVLVASHATAISMFTSVALGLSAETAKHVSLPSNASCTVFEYRDGVFYLRRYSEDSYLGDLRLTAPPTA